MDQQKWSDCSVPAEFILPASLMARLEKEAKEAKLAKSIVVGNALGYFLSDVEKFRAKLRAAEKSAAIEH